MLRRRLGNMRKWRNWQTRTFEGRVVHTVRVQVPFSAPKIDKFRQKLVDFYFFTITSSLFTLLSKLVDYVIGKSE